MLQTKQYSLQKGECLANCKIKADVRHNKRCLNIRTHGFTELASLPQHGWKFDDPSDPKVL